MLYIQLYSPTGSKKIKYILSVYIVQQSYDKFSIYVSSNVSIYGPGRRVPKSYSNFVVVVGITSLRVQKA